MHESLVRSTIPSYAKPLFSYLCLWLHRYLQVTYHLEHGCMESEEHSPLLNNLNSPTSDMRSCSFWYTDLDIFCEMGGTVCFEFTWR